MCLCDIIFVLPVYFISSGTGINEDTFCLAFVPQKNSVFLERLINLSEVSL